MKEEAIFETLPSSSCIHSQDVRQNFENGIYDKQDCFSLYKQWLQQDNYLVLKRTETEPNTKTKTSYRFYKCAKRGNDVYSFHLKKRFKEIGSENNELKKPQVVIIINEDNNMFSSNAVFGTLTFDPKKISITEAWQNIGIFYNRFLSNLKRKFQYLTYNRRYKMEELYTIRTWESHESGYPHIHFLVVFRNTKVFGFKYKNDIRINNYYRDKIKESWEWGFVDLKIPSDLKTLKSYLFKYISKSISLTDKNTVKENMTLAFSWMYNKRVFSFSKYIRIEDKIERLDTHNTNSNQTFQKNLNGEIITEIYYIYIGIATTTEGKNWFYEYDELPKTIELRRQKQYYGIKDMGFA